MPSSIRVGVCGFPRKAKDVFSNLDAVEIQSSFYEPLTEKRIDSIRKANEAKKDISVKAWQVITHPPGSPTWKKMRKRPEGDVENYGYLKPTEENFSAFTLSLSQAERLGAFALVLQTPPSMPYNEGHLKNIEDFFSFASGESSRKGIELIWEPRGSYAEDLRFLSKISEKGIAICSDYLRRGILVEGELMYSRLHGLGGREVNYRYRYSDEDLEKLKEMIFPFIGKRKIYIMFNNVYMFEDALRFKRILGEED
ncbi:MAG: DUF72 domain-containing protein [Desulfurococcales archaeon]